MKKIIIIITTVALIFYILQPLSEAADKTKQDSLRSSAVSVSHLQLKGTIFTKAMKPLAIIEDTRLGCSAMYEQGDMVEGLEIVRIERGEVVFKTPQGDYMLSFVDGPIIQTKAPLQEQLPLKNADNWYNIRREGNIFIVDETSISGAIQRIPEIMKDVRVSPCFIEGKPSGVVVAKLTPVGILKEAGVKEGDIIKNINGFTLNTPYQIFNAYQKLKDKKEIRVDIIRADKPLTLTYKVK